jgi:hypothetical protein
MVDAIHAVRLWLLSQEAVASILLSGTEISVLLPVKVIAMVLSIDTIPELLPISSIPIMLSQSATIALQLPPSTTIPVLLTVPTIASLLLNWEEVSGIGKRRLRSVAVGMIRHADRGDLYLRFAMRGL